MAVKKRVVKCRIGRRERPVLASTTRHQQRAKKKEEREMAMVRRERKRGGEEVQMASFSQVRWTCHADTTT